MLFLDTSALLKRYVAEDGTALVLQRMTDDGVWVASALARLEAEVALCRLGLEPAELGDVRRRLAHDWARFLVVPVDPLNLDRAARIGCDHAIRTLDALHLAAMERLPPPLTLLTFDRRQADAARSMGLAVEGATP